MREEEEEEICRVCRSEATPEQPLFHPCKCAGSIRYVHQDCLTEWLAHSRKKYCELCEHPFNFTPVYRADMPDKIPVRLFLVQLRKKLASVVIIVLRMILVSCIWLVLLPYFTIWIWRSYFSLGASLSRHLSRLQQVKHQISGGSDYFYNETMATNTTQTWLEEYKSRLTIHSFLADCFEGQVITCIVIIVFVAVFLLREWIVQNIPMEAPLNEDDELILDPHPIPAVAHIDLQQQQQPNELLDPQVQPTFHNIPWTEQSPSPVASPSWGNDEEIPSLQIEGLGQSEGVQYTRASSLPPTFSRTGSFHEPNVDGQSTFGFHRAASLEPFNNMTIGSRYEDRDVPENPFLPPELVFQGHPPNAPRMRHAEAPVGIQPILEENEHDQIPPAPLQPQENNADNNPDNDEEAEEFEGILEAIGMQGSLWSLFQNCSLMGLLIALSLGAAVWMPYLIGMLFVMTEIWDLVRLPLKIVSLLTDPFVDLLFWVSTDIVGPFIQPLLEDFASSSLYNHLSSLFDSMFNSAITSPSTISPVSQDSSLSLVDHFTGLIDEMKPVLHSAFQRYQALAIRQTALDRFLCIAIGYAVVAFFSCWYLTRSAQHRVATAALGRTAQETLRHQGIILKVGLFIAIELVLFPIICGYLLEFSTLPLFKRSTPSLSDLFSSNSVPSVFLHWFLGTGFMFVFAVLVNYCRSVLRPGVMWFIRDPNDPQFHPIREIIERPGLFQLRKIIASALIYLAVIMVGVGGIVHALDITSGQAILPLRWNFSFSRIPLSVVPVDLIILQLGLPALVKHFKPMVILKKLFVSWMKFTGRQLRLSSFLFGQRKADEEGALVYHDWVAWLKRTKPMRFPQDGTIENIVGHDVSYIWEGQLLRVPRHDNVPVAERRRMLVPVDPCTLLPLDETERQLGHPAVNATDDEEVNTTIVYGPPQFQKRILAFVGFMWLSCSFFLCSMVVLPILLGRTLFDIILNSEEKEVHDIYSFFVGAFVITSIGVVCCQIYNTVRDIASQTSLQGVLETMWYRTKQWSCWIYKWFVFAISFGLLIPVSLGILIELYSILPLKKLNDEEYSIEVATTWVNGFAFMILLHFVVKLLPNNRIHRALNNVFREGIHNMNVRLCIEQIISPFSLFCLAAIGLPSIIAYINLKVITRISPELRFKFMQIVYPVALIGVGSYYLTNFLYKIVARLAENIREDNYLVGRTLHNLDQ